MAEYIPYRYPPRIVGQGQRPPSGNMRNGAMGMSQPRPQPVPDRRPYPPTPPMNSFSHNTNTARDLHDTLPDDSKPQRNDPLAFLGINGLDNEKLILIALIVILAKNGADWVILAALIYIMM